MVKYIVYALLMLSGYVLTLQQVKAAQNYQSNPRHISKKKLKQKYLSMDLQNVTVAVALQLLAQFAKINMIITDSVKGRISLRLYHLPWRQALTMIIHARHLVIENINGAYIVSSAAALTQAKQQRLLAQKKLNALQPLTSRLIKLNYAKAEMVAKLIKVSGGNTLLSKRGKISVDNRMNTLWLEDIPTKVKHIIMLIKKLDKPLQQILITARIVTIEKNALKELGVRFGLTHAKHISGSLAAASALTAGTNAAEIPFAERLNMNLPAIATSAASPITIGVALAKLGMGVLLDLELSALQSENKAKIIASPRLLTMNQQQAVIETGQEIPYQEATDSGGTAVAFKKAVLSLRVTPQITADNHIILTLTVNQDARTADQLLGAPAINTRQIATQVAVNNGQTIVLGGIYQKTLRNQIERVPFLSDIPLLGRLFKRQRNEENLNELLIFVTPKIVKSK
ncbi:MAG: type IV pilus secretin PilQ [Pseudomonadota bacterium]